MTKPAKDTHPWPFPDADATSLTIDAAHISAIRSLAAIWDIGETGAPGLVLPDGEELEDHDLAPYVNLFLNAATLSATSGEIKNVLLSDAMSQDERAEFLAYIPDPELRAALASQATIPFSAEAEDLALWEEAQRGETGIDPKRPFGTGNVARDMRAILDPNKKLSRGAFTKLKGHRFARLILMLQFFVQNARLDPGEYWQTPQHGWRHATEMRKTPEHITEQEWVSRMQSTFYRAERGYCFDLRFFVFQAEEPVNLAGSYAEVAKRLDLEKNYTVEMYGPGPSYVLEKAVQFLKHWPEISGDFQDSFATHIAVRCCNAAGDFEQAAAHLDRAQLVLPDPKISLKAPVSPDESLWANMIVTRRGLGQISDSDFAAMFDASLIDGGTWADRVEQIYEGEEPRSFEDYDATYGQLKLMRAMLEAEA